MNRHYIISVLAISVLSFALGTFSFAAAAAHSAKRKPPVKTPHLSTIGTPQLPGDWCKFGQAYTLGKLTAMNVTINRAEYTTERVIVGNRVFTPEEGKKLLVVFFSLHNPLPKEQNVSYATIDWTAVDSKDQNTNQEYEGVGVEDGHAKLDQPMKPSQKIQLYAVLRVPADGEIPKLMVANHGNTGSPVARFDLRSEQTEHPHNTVKPIPAPYVDTTDKTGATPLKQVPGVVGTFFSTGILDQNVEKVDFVAAPLRDEVLDKDSIYVVFTIEYKYYGGGPNSGYAGLGGPISLMELKDADGMSYQPTYGYTMPLSSNRRVDSPSVKPGESLAVRVAFTVPNHVALRTLRLKETDGYPVMVDIGSYKAP